MNVLVAAPRASQTLRELTNLLVRRIVAFAQEGFGQEVWKAFARSFGALVFVWFDSSAYRVTVLRLFGWKCCF